MKKVALVIVVILVMAVSGYLLIAKNKNTGIGTNPIGTRNAGSTLSSYTLNQVASHNTESSCWMVINGNVYDVTAYIPEHPNSDILSGCGTDATTLYQGVMKHQGRANNMLSDYLIGSVSN